MNYSFADHKPARRPTSAALTAQTEVAFQLAQASPLVAARTLARGLRTQTRGAQSIALKEICSALLIGSNGNIDDYMRSELIAELRKLGA